MPVCPACGRSLERVVQPANSPLNRDQWEATIAGDWFCRHCPGEEGTTDKGKSGFAYFWEHQVEPVVSPQIAFTTLQVETAFVALQQAILQERKALLGQSKHFKDLAARARRGRDRLAAQRIDLLEKLARAENALEELECLRRRVEALEVQLKDRT